jgi:hypothetical protein
MPRKYYYRRPSYGSRDKYSVEQNTFRMTLGPELAQNSIIVVPSTTIEGMRKVKHLTISLSNSGSTANTVYWAIVYVPYGYTANNLRLPDPNAGGALYEPNQFVMNAGVCDLDAGPTRISTPIARNLNSGDSIYLILGSPGLGATMNLNGLVRYAITLQ